MYMISNKPDVVLKLMFTYPYNNQKYVLILQLNSNAFRIDIVIS